DVADHLIDRTTGDAEMPDLSLVAELLQRVERPAGSGDLLERALLRIMQEDKIDRLQPEQLLAAGKSFADGLRVEAAVRCRADLRVEECAVRQATQLAQDDADAPFALAIAVFGG